MKNKKIIGVSRLILILLFSVGLFIYLAIKLGKVRTQHADAFSEDIPSLFTLTPEDSNLFAKKYRDKLKVVEVYRSKMRNPISQITFDDKYCIFIYKIDLSVDSPLSRIFLSKIRSVDRTTGVTYSIIDNSIFYRFQYKSGSKQPVYKIHLTLAGDSLHTILNNDSTFYCHLLCDNLSIKYSNDGPVDIFVVGKPKYFGTIRIPMNLIFIKKSHCIYFMMMTPINPKSSINPELLLSITN